MRAVSLATGLGPRISPPVPAGYWRHAHLVALLVISTVAVRVHELFPVLTPFRPVALSVFGGVGLLIYHTPQAWSRLRRDRLFRLVAAYYGWALLTAPFALWVGRALQARTVFVPIFALATVFALCPPTRRNLEFIHVGFVAATAMFAVKVQLVGATIADRLTGIGSFDSNDIAAMMAFVFPLAVALLLRGRGKVRWLGLISIPALALTIAGTASRGGVLALCVASFVLIVGLKGVHRPLALTLVVVGGLATWHFGPPVFRERVLSLGSLDNDYNMNAFTGRKMIWKRARGYLMEHPISGVGWDNFETAEGQTLARMGIHAKWSAAHNSYVQAFVDLGFVGGGIFLLLLVSGGLTAIRLWRGGGGGARYPPPRRPELLASVCAFCTSAYFLSHAYSWPLFALLGLVFFAERCARAEARPAEIVPAPGPRHARRRLASSPWSGAPAGVGAGGLPWLLPPEPLGAAAERGGR